LLDRPLVARQHRILPGDNVRTILAAAGVRSVGADVRRSREATRRVDDRADLPAAEDRRADALLHERLAVAERQLVENRRDEAVPDVEHGQAPFALEAEAVLREQRVAAEGADAAAVVRGLGQRIS